ncbi:hypothetical protein BDW67DRAFT_186339 [Aspergillus spinulosporus]
MPVIGPKREVIAALQLRFSLPTRVCKGPLSSLHRLQRAARGTNSGGVKTGIEYENGMIKQQNEASNGSNTVNSTHPEKGNPKYHSLKEYRERPEEQPSEGFKTATKSAKDDVKYYSFKDYREGLNVESGKLESCRDSQETRTHHNWDGEDKHKKE